MDRDQSRTSTASGFFSGPAELLEFVLPVAAAQFLGATGAQTGALIATQLLVSLLIRPVAGILVDRGRTPRAAATIAAAGSGVGTVSFLLYAASSALLPAFAAAALGGAGGALFWVAVRALIADRLEAGDSRLTAGDDRFAALMESESSGSWIAFLIGIPLFQVAGPQAMFLACAVSCLTASLLLARVSLRMPATAAPATAAPATSAPATAAPATTAPATAPAPTLMRRLRGILLLAAVVAFAEGIISLLLILHLLDAGLDLGTIGLVYLPGAIVLSIAPRPLHRLVRRMAPRSILVIGLGCSAGFAAAMITRPGPVALAVLWILSALCFSLLVPLLERLVALVSGAHPGRGFGHYQSAELLGAATGSLAAGVLFGSGLWHLATIGAAAILVIAAVTGWFGLHRFPAADTTRRRKGLSAAMRRTATTLAIHIGIYLVAQVIFAVLAQSWPWEVITGNTTVATLLTWESGGGWPQGWIGSISRIWTIVLIVDIIWSGYRMAVPKERGPADE